MLSKEEKNKIDEMLQSGATVAEISKKLKISRTTVYSYLKSKREVGIVKKGQKEQVKEPEPKISEETREEFDEKAVKRDWDKFAELIAKIESGQPLTSSELYNFVEFAKKHFFTQDIIAQKMVQEGVEKASEKSLMTKLNDIIDDAFSLAMEMHYLKMQYESFCKEHDIDFKLLVRNALKSYVDGVTNYEELHEGEDLEDIKEILQYMLQLRDKQLLNNILLVKLING
jgi:transposase